MVNIKNLIFMAASSMLGLNAIGQNAVVDSAKDALKRSVVYMRSIATHGGYLWKYSLDGRIRYGESRATDTQIWIQPPGTPAMGMAFLKAYDATGDAYYLDSARDAALALVKGQLESGGWDYQINFDSERSTRWYRRSDIGKISDKEIDRRKNNSTYDDNNTQSALMFLMQFIKASPDELTDSGIRTALNYGLRKMVEAQYPNGAWPQRYDGKARNPENFPVIRASIPKRYPRQYVKRDYKVYYTLNDNTQRDLIRVMLKAWKQFGNTEYRNATRRGGEFLLLAQLPEPQPIWAQQYNLRMEPDWARAFEPPAACGGESVGAMQMLIDLYVEFGDAKYLEPIPRVLNWYERSTVAPNTWNRYYELGTGKPIFGDRDGQIHYTLEELSKERQNGYGWRGNFGFTSAKLYYEKVMERGREHMLKKLQPQVLSDDKKRSRMKSLESRVKEAIAELDNQGRWITRKQGQDKKSGLTVLIETDRFIDNSKVLSNYLELAE